MNDLLIWNILAMLVLAIPCGLLLKVCWDAMLSGMDPKLFMGLLVMVGLGYCVFIGNIAYFKEEGKHD